MNTSLVTSEESVKELKRKLADAEKIISALRKDEVDAVISSNPQKIFLLRLKESEEALQRSEEKYRLLLQYAPTGIYEIDFRGPKFTSVNDAACLLSGYSREEFLAMNAMNILDKESQVRFQERIKKMLTGQKVDTEVDYTVVKKDGSRISVILHTKPIYTEGKITGALVVGYDITERKQAENALRDARELAEERAKILDFMNKELESFNYSIAHDLRAPLRSINGFSGILTEEYADKLDEQGKRYLEKIQKNATSMSELIDDLLRLAKISQTILKVEEVDVTALSERIIETMREADPSREITVKIAKGMTTRADASLLEILLKNLFTNAWKFTTKTDHPVINIGTTKEKGTTVFFVKDNGVGFDQDHANKLFKAFERLHGTEFAGSGIGLAIAQRIINRHHGSIWAEGKVGKGATFYFSLSLDYD